jgi:hypothetical protein
MKTMKAGADNLARYGGSDDRPKSDRGVDLEGWQWIPVQSVGDIGLWVNVRSEVFRQIMHDHTTRLKFLERLAQSFAARNAMTAHPAMPTTCNAQNGVADIRVICWTRDYTAEQLGELSMLAQKNDLHKYADEPVDVQTLSMVDIEPDEIAAVETELDEARGHERQQAKEAGIDAGDDADDDGGDIAGGPSSQELLDDATRLYGELARAFGRPNAKKVVTDTGASSLEEATDEELAAFITAANAKMGGDNNDQPHSDDESSGEDSRDRD